MSGPAPSSPNDSMFVCRVRACDVVENEPFVVLASLAVPYSKTPDNCVK